MEECPRSERCDFIRRDVDFLSFSQGDAADAGETSGAKKKLGHRESNPDIRRDRTKY